MCSSTVVRAGILFDALRLAQSKSQVAAVLVGEADAGVRMRVALMLTKAQRSSWWKSVQCLQGLDVHRAQPVLRELALLSPPLAAAIADVTVPGVAAPPSSVPVSVPQCPRAWFLAARAELERGSLSKCFAAVESAVASGFVALPTADVRLLRQSDAAQDVFSAVERAASDVTESAMRKVPVSAVRWMCFRAASRVVLTCGGGADASPAEFGSFAEVASAFPRFALFALQFRTVLLRFVRRRSDAEVIVDFLVTRGVSVASVEGAPSLWPALHTALESIELRAVETWALADLVASAASTLDRSSGADESDVVRALLSARKHLAATATPQLLDVEPTKRKVVASLLEQLSRFDCHSAALTLRLSVGLLDISGSEEEATWLVALRCLESFGERRGIRVGPEEVDAAIGVTLLRGAKASSATWSDVLRVIAAASERYGVSYERALLSGEGRVLAATWAAALNGIIAHHRVQHVPVPAPVMHSLHALVCANAGWEMGLQLLRIAARQHSATSKMTLAVVGEAAAAGQWSAALQVLERLRDLPSMRRTPISMRAVADELLRAVAVRDAVEPGALLDSPVLFAASCDVRSKSLDDRLVLFGAAAAMLGLGIERAHAQGIIKASIGNAPRTSPAVVIALRNSAKAAAVAPDALVDAAFRCIERSPYFPRPKLARKAVFFHITASASNDDDAAADLRNFAAIPAHGHLRLEEVYFLALFGFQKL